MQINNENESTNENENRLGSAAGGYSINQNSILINPALLAERQLSTSSSYNESSPLFRQNNPLFQYNIQITSDQTPNDYKFSFRKLWKFIGPGFLMSVAYLDPGNLESDLQTGAVVGYKLLWVLLVATMIGFLLQSLAVRLGATTGFNLAEVCRKEYHPLARYFLWIMIEISIISSDIQQVIGSALAINLLSQEYIPIWAAILITAADTFVFLFLENTGLRVLEAIFGVFISIMCISFLYIYIRVDPNQIDVMKGFIPWCSNCSYIEMKHLVGIVGSIVMPHNIYFHSTLVLSRNFDRRNEHAINEANKYYAIDSGVALFISFLCNLFVVSSFAKVFYGTKYAENVTLVNAGPYIYKEYGILMQVIWAIGLLSAGQASTITGTYAGQFVMEGFTKIKLTKWIRILIIRSITILCSITIALFAYVSIDELNFWCNVIQSIQLPFALLPILHFTASKRIMGPFKSNVIVQIFCYITAAFIIGVNFYVVINIIIKANKLVYYILCGFLLAFYTFVLVYYSLGVNNAYRIGLLIRRLCCTPYAHELDELLHTSPVYTHPQKSRKKNNSQQKQQQQQQQKKQNNSNKTSQQNSSLSHLNSLSTSINQQLDTEPEEIGDNYNENQQLTESEEHDQEQQQQQHTSYNTIMSNNLNFLANHFNNSTKTNSIA